MSYGLYSQYSNSFRCKHITLPNLLFLTLNPTAVVADGSSHLVVIP